VSFVKTSSHLFRHVCDTNYPFSSFETSKNTTDLRGKLDFLRKSTLTYFILQDNAIWRNEEELEARFGEHLGSISISQIIDACAQLKKSYENGDNKSGYFLLWLIKRTIGGQFTIPPKEEFTSSTVKKVLCSFVCSEGRMKRPTECLELLFLETKRGRLYQDLLDDESYSLIVNFSIHILAHSAMDEWP